MLLSSQDASMLHGRREAPRHGGTWQAGRGGGRRRLPRLLQRCRRDHHVVGAAGTPSGVYGLSVDNGIGTDIIPFYVLRNPALPRQKILFLAPTFTYMAYANHARGNFSGALHARVKEWNAYPHNPDVVGAYGHSTYNRHPDGSGVTLSSRLRPIMTMRPQYLLGRK